MLPRLFGLEQMDLSLLLVDLSKFRFNSQVNLCLKCIMCEYLDGKNL